MARKNRTPEENARREKIRELLQIANIDSMEDIQSLFKETIAEFMENGLETELDDKLGYSKYDYKNKDTDNSRNGFVNRKIGIPSETGGMPILNSCCKRLFIEVPQPARTSRLQIRRYRWKVSECDLPHQAQFCWKSRNS